MLFSDTFDNFKDIQGAASHVMKLAESPDYSEPVEDYFKAYITDTMLAPNTMDIEPASFQPKTSLTDEDVERAIRAVDLARSYSHARSV